MDRKDVMKCGDGKVTSDKGMMAQRGVLRAVWKKMEESSTYQASRPYVAANYWRTSLAFAQAIPEGKRCDAVGLYQGLKMLALCRVGGLRTAIQIANASQGADDAEMYKKTYPCCGKSGEGETISHILLDCGRWADARQKHLGSVMGKIRVMSRLTLGRLILVLGGEYKDQKLEGWLPAKQGASSQPSHGVDGARNCIAFEVAAFFKEIAGARYAVLSQLKRSLGGESQGSPLQSQSPMGRVSLDRQDLGF